MEKIIRVNRSTELPLENKNCDKGITLLLSLLISFIVAFALAVELLNIRLNEKNIGLTRQQDQLFYSIEKKMNDWINDPYFYADCLYPVNNLSDPNKYPDQLLQKIISGCVLQEKNILLNAVTEDLGFMPCINIDKIVETKKVSQAAHFYRMSVYGENSKKSHLILQMVFAVPEINTLDTCPSENFKVIDKGRQSWRIFLK